MALNLPNQDTNISIPDNLYTAVLAVSFFIVLATAAFVAYMCYSQYGTFGTPI